MSALVVVLFFIFLLTLTFGWLLRIVMEPPTAGTDPKYLDAIRDENARLREGALTARAHM